MLLISGATAACALAGRGSTSLGYPILASASVSPGPTDAPTRPWIQTWTAVPTEPLTEFVEAAMTRCWSSHDSPAAAPVVDQRGPDGAAFFWHTSTFHSACLVLREDDGLVVLELGGGNGFRSVTTVEEDEPPPFKLTFEALSVRPAVERIALGAADGVQVSATVQDGWAIGWWPSRAGRSPAPSTAAVLTASPAPSGEP